MICCPLALSSSRPFLPSRLQKSDGPFRCGRVAQDTEVPHSGSGLQPAATPSRSYRLHLLPRDFGVVRVVEHKGRQVERFRGARRFEVRSVSPDYRDEAAHHPRHACLRQSDEAPDLVDIVHFRAPCWRMSAITSPTGF